MKVRLNRFLAASITLAAFALSSPANAADLTWIDINTNSIWDLTQPNWNPGVIAWTDGSNAIFGGTAETVTLGAAIATGTTTVNITGYTLALANNTLAATSLNYGGVAGGTLSFTGTAGTANAQNTVSLSGPGTGWISGTSVALTGNANPAVGSTQHGALLKLVLGDATALGSAELKVKHAMIQTGAAGMTVTNNITNAGASLYFGGEYDFTVSGVVKNDSGSPRTIGVWAGSGGSRTITLGDLNTNGQTFNFEARGSAANPNPGGGFVVNGKITGAGGVSTVGTGQFPGNILTLNGASDYTGATSMLSGRLQLNGSLTSAVAISSGATLAGPGSTTGLLTMNTDSLLSLAGGATTTSLTSAGVTFAGNTFLTFATPPVTGTVYDVVSYGAGTLTNLTNLRSTTHGTFGNPDGKITFTAGTPGQTRTWSGVTGTWDVGVSTTWQEGDQLFCNGDPVIFNEPAAANTVTLSGALKPASVALTNSTNTYTFAGGSITGATSLAKSGAGALAISSQQSYTGGTTVDGGILDLTGGGGINGTIRGTLTVSNGGLLKLSTADATGYGTGAARLGVINLVDSTLNVNTTGNQTLGSAALTLTGGAITGIAASNLDFFGGGSTLSTLASATTSTISLPTIRLRQNETVFDIADGDAANDLLISSNIGQLEATFGRALTKNGAGTLKLTGISTFDGNLTVNQGVVDLTSPGAKLYNGNYNPTSIITVHADATLKLDKFTYDTSQGKLSDYAARRVLNGGAFEVVGNTHLAGNDFTVTANGGVFRYNPTLATDTLTLTGNANSNIPIAGELTFRADGNIIVGETIEGDGSLVKTGDRTLTLSGPNTYKGTTTVSEGTLAVTGSLDASTVTVVSDATLAGNGNIGGSVIIQAGGHHALAVAATTAAQITRTISGVLDLSAASDILDITAAAPPAGGVYVLATATGGITGVPDSVNQTGVAGTFAINGNNLELTVVGTDYDAWINGFTFDAGADMTAAGDPDHDGLTNQQEYAFGLAPNDGSSVNPIAAALDPAAGTFTYTRRDDALTTLTYKVWTSTDLATWTEDTGATQNDSAGPDAQGVEPVVVTLSAAKPLAAPALFVRVSAE